MNRLDEVHNRKSHKVFLLIGTNDLAKNISSDSVVKNIIWIAALLRQKSPQTKLYVQSIFPVNEKFGKFSGHTSKKQQISVVNKMLWQHGSQYGYIYIDVFSALADSTGRLSAVYTNDGLHLTGAGYMKWKETIYNEVYDFPALIPFPIHLKWVNEKVSLSNFQLIVAETRH
ncbi:MAG: hypothetical protein IPP73_19690 [Chitinophagaceae bacterium]|nr:hypothetical protein [Chitinophagaceae bacterium]